MLEFVKSLSIIVAAITAAYGINAWRRETRGKKEIDLAEEVLALFYEGKDKIQYVRNPFGRSDEGTSRKRGEHESEEISKILDQAYVVVERYNKVEDTFTKLRSRKYRFMALFGRETGKLFDDLNKILDEIMVSAHMLGSHYWQRQGRSPMEGEEFERHLKEMHKHEAIFWAGYEEPDKVAQEVDNLISRVELVCSKALQPPESLWTKTKRYFTAYNSGITNND
jgi:hypothetical protein